MVFSGLTAVLVSQRDEHDEKCSTRKQILTRVKTFTNSPYVLA